MLPSPYNNSLRKNRDLLCFFILLYGKQTDIELHVVDFDMISLVFASHFLDMEKRLIERPTVLYNTGHKVVKLGFVKVSSIRKRDDTIPSVHRIHRLYTEIQDLIILFSMQHSLDYVQQIIPLHENGEKHNQ